MSYQTAFKQLYVPTASELKKFKENTLSASVQAIENNPFIKPVIQKNNELDLITQATLQTIQSINAMNAMIFMMLSEKINRD